jgi:GLPGLI family protein
MKKIRFSIACLWLLLASTPPATAQSLSSGSISYEAMRRIDPSKMKIMINGQEVKPGSAEAPPDMPEVRTFSLNLVFSGNYAKEEHDGAAPVIRRMDVESGSGVSARTTQVEPPFTERKYVDLPAQKYLEVLEIKKDGTTKAYCSEEPFRKVTDWKEAGQTRKIAGYACRKATCPWKGETYTIWYTTDLPFTYSPIKDLTPEKGVVLQLEGNEESFKATRIVSKAVAESEVKPPVQAEAVSQEQLTEIREKAMATFRQQLFSSPDR